MTTLLGDTIHRQGLWPGRSTTLDFSIKNLSSGSKENNSQEKNNSQGSSQKKFDAGKLARECFDDAGHFNWVRKNALSMTKKTRHRPTKQTRINQRNKGVFDNNLKAVSKLAERERPESLIKIIQGNRALLNTGLILNILEQIHEIKPENQKIDKINELLSLLAPKIKKITNLTKSKLIKLFSYTKNLYTVPSAYYLAITKLFKKSNFNLEKRDVKDIIRSISRSEDVPKKTFDLLTQQIRKNKLRFGSEEISHMLYYLQEKREPSTKFLEELAEQLINKKSGMSNEQITKSFTGLQNFNSIPEKLLKSLTKHLEKAQLNINEASKVLYGLRSLPSAPDDLLSLIKNTIRSSNHELNATILNRILIACHNKLDFELLELLQKKISANLLKSDPSDPIAIASLNFSGKLIRFKCQDKFDEIFGPHFIKDLEKEFEAIKDNLDINVSSQELAAQEIIAKTYNNAQAVKYNYYIDGRELDIFLPKLKINIELDGIYHRGKKRHSDQIRDKYLMEAHGIKVIRIDSVESRNWKNQIHNLMQKYNKQLAA